MTDTVIRAESKRAISLNYTGMRACATGDAEVVAAALTYTTA